MKAQTGMLHPLWAAVAAGSACAATQAAGHATGGGTGNIFGDNAFGTRIIASSGDGLYNVVAADMDRDGDIDLVGLSRGQPFWFENNGQDPAEFTRRRIDAAWEEPKASSRALAVADIDRNGTPDIVAVGTGVRGSSGYGHVRALLNSGGSSPTFRQAWLGHASRGLQSLVIADLDRDGDMDIATGGVAPAVATWWLNPGSVNRPFNAVSVANEGGVGGAVAVGDIDGDGDVDMALVRGGAARSGLEWYEQLPPPDNGIHTSYREAGTIFARHTIDTGLTASAITLTDLDKDRRMDIAVGARSSRRPNGVRFYHNKGLDGDGDVRFAGQLLDESPNISQLVRADIDRDNRPDLVAYDESSDELFWLRGVRGPSGEPLFEPIVLAGRVPQVTGMAVIDLDADGDADPVVSISRGVGYARWFENPFTAVLEGCIADINRDGVANSSDFNAWLAAFVKSEPAGDTNGDGQFDGRDLNELLHSFSSSCG